MNAAISWPPARSAGTAISAELAVPAVESQTAAANPGDVFGRSEATSQQVLSETAVFQEMSPCRRRGRQVIRRAGKLRFFPDLPAVQL